MKPIKCAGCQREPEAYLYGDDGFNEALYACLCDGCPVCEIPDTMTLNAWNDFNTALRGLLEKTYNAGQENLNTFYGEYLHKSSKRAPAKEP